MFVWVCPLLTTIAKSVWLSYYPSSTGSILMACLDVFVAAAFLAVTGGVVCGNCDVFRFPRDEKLDSHLIRNSCKFYANFVDGTDWQPLRIHLCNYTNLQHLCPDICTCANVWQYLQYLGTSLPI